ncbi:hypothetical protein Droror1_Dr00008131 [Drosera rotundifolia]
MYCNSSDHLSPCLHCHPHTYIRMVQHLIERCLILQMNRDECIRALEEHAKIRPVITLTVWTELLKENRGFFQAYFHDLSSVPLWRRDVEQFSPWLSRVQQRW